MRRPIFACLITLLVALAACSGHQSKAEAPSVDTIPMMVMRIQQCSRLYTAEYHVHKIITHDDKLKISGKLMQKPFSIDLPAGKRKVAIPIDATIKAYIDFGGFSKDNIRRQGDHIEIVLPDPKVALTASKIDHDGVKQFVALTRSNFSDEELTRLEQQGRQAIVNDIPNMDIIERARENAANTLIPMVEQMGYRQENIKISFRKEFTRNDILKLVGEK